MSFEFEAGFFCELLREGGLAPRRVLVLGCGDGAEAHHITHATGARVTGVDLVVDSAARGEDTGLVRADARSLPFRPGTFDAVYCYHVLEHIPGPERAVSEARRVLADGGMAFFGVPNKSRWVGYLGGRATWPQKVQWNFADYRRRLTGQWTNEQGAHAGFTEHELESLLHESFAAVQAVSRRYYQRKFPHLQRYWPSVERIGLARFLAPSVYFRTGAR